MAKLYFYYSAMNAGKSTTLLQAAYNYEERGMRVLLYTPKLDHRAGEGIVASRIGLERAAVAFDTDFDLYEDIKTEHKNSPVSCVFLDESQFLTPAQVLQLTIVCDRLRIPVLCYGLRTDFRGEPFEGSKYLLAWADSLGEIKTICHSGKKATMNARLMLYTEVTRNTGRPEGIVRVRLAFWAGNEPQWLSIRTLSSIRRRVKDLEHKNSPGPGSALFLVFSQKSSRLR
ncbi:UNVERIFIED_CONTAM: hypothetical protein GTU68_066167 [Idotea baltica]|nr:hypothetical protein [Idotea baltica]